MKKIIAVITGLVATMLAGALLADTLELANGQIHEGNFVGRFSQYPMIICDEADTLESLLTSFVELKLYIMSCLLSGQVSLLMLSRNSQEEPQCY